MEKVNRPDQSRRYLTNWFDDEALDNPSTAKRMRFQKVFMAAAESVLDTAFPVVKIEIMEGLGTDPHSKRFELVSENQEVLGKANITLTALMESLHNSL